MTQSAAAPLGEPVHAAKPSPITSFSTWLKRDGSGILCAASVAYFLLYAVFWPVLYSTMDEAAYMNLAYAIEHGTIYLDVARVAPVQAYHVGPHILSLYPPGMGALLAGFGFLGWNVALGFNLFVHLALFWLVVLLLRKNKTPALFALLYLLHPVAVLYSHTVLSDLAASLCLTLGFLCTLNRRYLLCGVCIGIAVLVRTVSAIAGVFFAAGILLEGTRFFRADNALAFDSLALRIRRVVLVALGVLPLFALAYFYQKVIQDGGWAKYAQPGMISPRYLPVQLPFYTVALLVLYPGLLLAPLFYKGVGRATLLAFTYGFFAFYCCFYFHDEGASRADTFIRGQRFLLVILPLMIVAYSRVIWDWAKPRVSVGVGRILALGICFALFAGAAFVQKKHEDFLLSLRQIRQAALRATPTGDTLFCNVQLAKTLHPGWANRSVALLLGGGSEESDVKAAVSAVRAILKTTRRPVTVALWSRAYRPETPRELAVLHALENEFVSTPAPPNAALPNELYMIRITGEKQNRSKATPASAL